MSWQINSTPTATAPNGAPGPQCIRPRAGGRPPSPRLAALALSLAALGCSPAAGDRVLVLAAASTIDAMETATSDFEQRTGIEVDVSFGPTSTLARQIEQGAPADILLSASREWAEHVEQRVEVRRSAVLVGNTLVVIKPVRPLEGVAPSLRDFFDDPDRRRIAIADPQSVPAGIYARQALRNLGLWETVAPRLIPTIDVRAARALVAADEADAGIVYRTDVHGPHTAVTPDVIRVDGIDPALHDPIEYPLLLLATAGTGADELYDFLLSRRGRQFFFDRGFIDPEATE